MRRRLLSLGVLCALTTFSPAGTTRAFEAPVLPEIRQHLDDGWACLPNDPGMARAHAMAVLGRPGATIQVVLDGVPSNRRNACRSAIDGAVDAWEHAIGDGFHFNRVGEGDKGDIVVKFQRDVYERGEPVAGYVNWKRVASSGEGGVTGDVQIRTVNLDGSWMPMKAMRHIVIHEIGHMLGLDDTQRMGEAMSPLDVDHPLSAPTEAEAAAVRSLRSEANRILQDAR